MYTTFAYLKSYLKFDDTSIDNFVFRLHYRVTVIALLASAILVTLIQYFGDPINCVAHNIKVHDAMKNYCWITATYTLPNALDKQVGFEVSHPGLDKSQPGDARVYHKYYQWVSFFLAFQALLFYVPRFLWKKSEKGTVRKLVDAVEAPMLLKYSKGKTARRPTEMLNKDKKEVIATGRQHLAEYLNKRSRKQSMNAYVLFACEIMNFINVVGQIYLVNTFLGGEFTTYGTKVLSVSEQELLNRTDPMVKVFPRVTKCDFHQYGPTGEVQKLDLLCVLPLNIINEKIFIFFWFWFVLLAIPTGLNLIYRIAVIFSVSVRRQVIRIQDRFAGFTDDVDQFLTKGNINDWLVLSCLCTNLDPMNFHLLVKELNESIKQ